MSPSFFDFIASVLLLEEPEGLSAADRRVRSEFVHKFQQFTGPVTAKGLEDTAFYRYFPLASLNEVGGDPSLPGISIEQFHRRVIEQSSSWPHTMLASGSHDTKRGEDLRARLNVLAELPEAWESAIKHWHELNADSRLELDGAPVPDANEEYLIYQTLVGTWPLETMDHPARAVYIERLVRYVDKALREAKLHTSWLNPYEEYDQGVANFIRSILGRLDSPFLQELDNFVRSIADAGFVNSLAQTLVKISAPGVPDFYQGVEFWDFNLVDPDNRRAVDFEIRRESLRRLATRAREGSADLAAELLGRWPSEQLKMFTIWKTLQFRRASQALLQGSYQPLFAEGPRKAQLCAFARVAASAWAVCVVPRLVYQATREVADSPRRPAGEGSWSLSAWWQDTQLLLPAEAPRLWRHVLTDRPLQAVDTPDGGCALDLQEVFRVFPVALLAAETS